MRLCSSAFLAIVLPGAAFASTNDVLRTTAAVNAFYRTASSESRPFDLTGVVLASTVTSFTLEDGTGRVWLGHHGNHGLSVADKANVKGIAYFSPTQEPSSTLTEARVIGKAGAKTPADIDLSSLNQAKNDLLPVRTVGKVIDLQPDEVDARYAILLLKSGATRLPLFVRTEDFPNASEMIDATIRVTGTFNRTIRGIRKYSGAYIHGEKIEVVDRAPDDPFNAPQLEQTRYLSPDEVIAFDKRKACGETLATWNRSFLMLRADDGRVVNVKLSADLTLPEPGDRIDVVGYPVTDLFRINLMNARWRPSAQKDPPPGSRAEAPKDIDVATILYDGTGARQIAGAFHGSLLRFRGVVRSKPTAEGPTRRFGVDTGTSRAVVDVSTHPDVVDRVEIGAEVEVTGRCLVEAGEWSPYDIFPQPSGFAIVIRSPADIRTLRSPPWWTPARFLAAVAILLAVLAAIVLWNLTLHVLVRRRTHEMFREQIGKDRSEQRVIERTHLAYELHDALSQNLTGVALELKTVSRTLARNVPTALLHLKRAEQVLGSCREELRNCLWDLRNDAIGLSSMTDAVRMTVAPHLGDAKLDLDFDVPRSHISDNTVHAILRIVRELVANALRHGKATALWITGRVDADRGLTIAVADNGCGFDPTTAPGCADGHFGLCGIRARLSAVDGDLQIASSSEGTVATVTINLNRSEEDPDEED